MTAPSCVAEVGEGKFRRKQSSSRSARGLFANHHPVHRDKRQSMVCIRPRAGHEETALAPLLSTQARTCACLPQLPPADIVCMNPKTLRTPLRRRCGAIPAARRRRHRQSIWKRQDHHQTSPSATLHDPCTSAHKRRRPTRVPAPYRDNSLDSGRAGYITQISSGLPTFELRVHPEDTPTSPLQTHVNGHVNGPQTGLGGARALGTFPLTPYTRRIPCFIHPAGASRAPSHPQSPL